MRKFLLLLSAFCLLQSVTAQSRDFTRWVNPFIGTGGHGHTFPGATLPFGMVQLSPDTRTDNWDGSSGYHYSDDVIYGFSHTHLSGTGIPDGCDILFMPTVGSGVVEEHSKPGFKGYPSKFDHANERAEPGYYSVMLDDFGIRAELTATTRVGLHRYTFPKSDRAVVFLDLVWRDKLLESSIKMINSTTIEGFRRSSSWAKNQRVYFVAEFSRPFRNGRLKGVEAGKPEFARGEFEFSTADDQQVLIKVAISYVSIEGARKNLEAELSDWDFDKVRADAKAAWSKELSKIEVSGGTDDQTTTFYTALYHTMIHPNVFNDVDGSYLGHDRKVHRLPDYEKGKKGEGEKGRQESDTANPKSKIQNPKSNQYTVFSLWDTFRAAHPLYTIIDQKRTVDFINTFIRIYEQGGRLPVWELWGEETDTMIGYHAVSVIADAMAKGIEGFDYQKAYEASKHSADLDHFGLAAYKKRGYISSEDENESVSKTLEYTYDDWCIARMAAILCDKGLAECKKVAYADGALIVSYHPDGKVFGPRLINYQNLFDKQTGFMRPRRNGGWVAPFQPNEVTFNFTEGNSWQYSFFVPHDILGMIDLYGGRTAFGRKLTELFTTTTPLTGREQPDITGLIGQYAHGNEPSHHAAYLFNYADQPGQTQKYVRKIMDEFYKATPDGLVGNEDCGQMSAWYVLSALGFYPVTPGLPEYQLGTPIFKEAILNLESGKKFIIRAPGVSEKNFYVKSATLNGKRFLIVNRPSFSTTALKHSDLMTGGVLEFQMSDKPGILAFPWIAQRKSGSLWLDPAVPVITSPGKSFKETATITISTRTPNTRIYYTLDGSEPSANFNEYRGPITIDRNTQVRAVAVGVTKKSLVAEAYFQKRPNDWTVKIVSPYSTQYTGGGDDAIVDGIRGTTNFTSGEWQGYQGKTFEAVIDLQKQTEIKSVGGSFLQAAGSWIWMPDRIEFEVSNDGMNFTHVAEIKPGFPQQEMNPVVKEFSQPITPVTARYVRVRALNFGKIPTWHPGAGGDPWMFVDEILIN